MVALEGKALPLGVAVDSAGTIRLNLSNPEARRMLVEALKREGYEVFEGKPKKDPGPRASGGL
jgi:hypothetical protein